MALLSKDDFVFNTVAGGGITSIGYNIKSHLLSGDQAEPALHMFNDPTDKNMVGGSGALGAVSDIFKGLAVPAGLLYLQQNIEKRPTTKRSGEPVSPRLIDRLLELASEPSKKPAKSRKKRKSRGDGNKSKSKTRRKT